MHKPIEMIFIDELDEFMKLVEALNAGDQTCPVYLAFRNGAMPHWTLVTNTIRASFNWQNESETFDVDGPVQRMEKFTFVIRPTRMIFTHHDTSLISEAPLL